MQADNPERSQSERFFYGRVDSHNWIPHEGFERPRRCRRGCHNLELTDRVYHCKRRSQCLPVYDHYCPHIKVVVYLRTMKPYLYTLLFCFVDALFSFSVAIAALAKGTPSVLPFCIAVLASIGAGVVVLWANTWDRWQYLALRNQVGAGERDPTQLWLLGFRYRTPGKYGDWRLHIHRFDQNPWDLGWKANLRQVLGEHWW
ncbi:hypothetical protein F5Y15DRAFT_341599 [Xylariaceae sp. FL0016]|nr:hypothetical protein F5Y15DRAFT_341599 [Xylariaceae sp. FL0016]